MRLTKKALRATIDALDSAAETVAERHVSDVWKRPPDDWDPDERRKFDLIYETKHALEDALKAVFGERPAEPSDISEIDAANYSIGKLHTALITGEIAVPVWIRSGRARHKVSASTRDDFCRGLLLALEMTTK